MAIAESTRRVGRLLSRVGNARLFSNGLDVVLPILGKRCLAFRTDFGATGFVPRAELIGNFRSINRLRTKLSACACLPRILRSAMSTLHSVLRQILGTRDAIFIAKL